MRKISLMTAILLLLLSGATVSYGSGFQLNLQGLRQLAMGGAGTAWVWDASTIFYNPGGLSRLKSPQAYVGVVMLNPRTQFVPSVGTSEKINAKNQTFTPFNVYVGGTVGKDKKIGLGLGVYVPFGSGVAWDDNWTGRFVIQSIKLQTVCVQPTVSYKINEMVSVGGGFIYAFGSFKIVQAIPTDDLNGGNGQGTLEGKANGIGYNLGLHIQPNKKIQVGITYRSRINMKVDNGDATFTVPASVASYFPNTKVTSSVPLPSVFSVGVGVKVTSKLTIVADVNAVGWNSYDSLRFDFDQHTDRLKDNHAPRLYKNTVSYRLGFHYKVSKMINLMIGGAIDPSPVQDGYVSPDLPDANRKIISGGFTIKATSRLSVLGVVEYAVSEKRESTYLPANFSGTYQTKVFNPGIGLTYNFNK